MIMEHVETAIVSLTLGFSIGAGWVGYMRHAEPPRDPTEKEIDAWMDKHWYLVDEAEQRRRSAIMRDANRKTMPQDSGGKPTRQSGIRVSRSQKGREKR
jgi:hypothetical protein